jgi:hypothetical protein
MSAGFTGRNNRGSRNVDVPPGQYVTGDFPRARPGAERHPLRLLYSTQPPQRCCKQLSWPGGSTVPIPRRR